MKMTPEKYFRKWAENCRVFINYRPIHDHEDMMRFAKDYHESQGMNWINTKNRLPEEDVYVLIWYNEEPQQVYRDGDDWHWMDKDQSAPTKGTSWMEITPPEE